MGPGLGSLTLALLETGAEVTAVEIDPTLAEALAAGIKAISSGEEEPPDVGRSLSQLFAL